MKIHCLVITLLFAPVLGAQIATPNWLDIRTYGAVANDGIDDWSAIQSAINAAAAMTEGSVVYVPPGRFHISLPLTITGQVVLKGDGRVRIQPGEAPKAGMSIIQSISDGGEVLIRLVSVNANQHLFGAEIRDLCLDGAGIGLHGIHASSIANCTFHNLLIFKVTGNGILLDDANGLTSLHNRISHYQFNAGATCTSAHGIEFLDTNLPTKQEGVVQTYVGDVVILTQCSDGMVLGGCDNNMIVRLYHFVAVKEPDYFAIRFTNGQAFPARNNLVMWVNGNIHAESLTYGNRIFHLISEGSSVTADAGAQLHYEVEDYANSELFRTHSYFMSDEYDVPSGAFVPDGVVARFGTNAVLWSAIEFPDNNSGNAKTNIALPARWSNGKIASITVKYSSAANNPPVGQFNRTGFFKLRALSLEHGEHTSAIPIDTTFTLEIIENKNRLNSFTVPITGLFYKRGDTILLRFSREPLDPADNMIGDFELLGITVNYVSDGPNSDPSQTYAVTLPYR